MSRTAPSAPQTTRQHPPVPLLDASVRRLRGVVDNLQLTLDAAALSQVGLDRADPRQVQPAAGRDRNHARPALAGDTGALLDSLPAAVLVIDSRGRIAVCNQAARDLLGDGLPGQTWTSVVRHKLSASEDGTELILGDGRRLSVASQSLRHTAGQVVMLSDVSETRALQLRLQRRSRLAEMGEMLARLAHQLGTPLATCALYARELGQAGDDAARRYELAQRIEQSLARLRSQVRDMQMFTSTATVAARPIRMDALLERFFELSNPAYAAAGAALTIDSRVGDCTVDVNAAAISSVFCNLADNALQARPRGLRLSVNACRAGEELEIAFADNGPGIDPRAAAQMFEAFFTTRAEGTGLGLAVAKSVLEAHGGSIEHDAAAPGCRLLVRLPVAGDAA